MSNDADLGVLVRPVGSNGAWDAPEMTAYLNEDHPAADHRR
jgi:hypothetical protein